MNGTLETVGMGAGEVAAGDWRRAGPYHWEGPGHCLVSAALIGGDAGEWRYSAWTAMDKPELKYWDWRMQAGGREHYALGKTQPQRRALLGVYRTAAEARQACLRWLARKEGPWPGVAAREGAGGQPGERRPDGLADDEVALAGLVDGLADMNGEGLAGMNGEGLVALDGEGLA